jgi:hypothetical protein
VDTCISTKCDKILAQYGINEKCLTPSIFNILSAARTHSDLRKLPEDLGKSNLKKINL